MSHKLFQKVTKFGGRQMAENARIFAEMAMAIFENFRHILSSVLPGWHSKIIKAFSKRDFRRKCRIIPRHYAIAVAQALSVLKGQEKNNGTGLMSFSFLVEKRHSLVVIIIRKQENGILREQDENKR